MQSAIVAISLGISQGETYMIEIVGFDTSATLAYVSCMFTRWNNDNLEVISQKGSFTLAFKGKVVYFKSNGPIGYGTLLSRVLKAGGVCNVESISIVNEIPSDTIIIQQ